MSLTVEVTAEGFTKRVADALAKICGGPVAAVDAASGKVSIGAPTCSAYCDHRAGTNMLADLVGDEIAFTIWYSENSSGYENHEIWWYPRTVDFGDKDVCGGTSILPYILLAHEMVHARKDSLDEPIAVRGENQVRLENCVPMRMDYAGSAVADFRTGVLDASARPGYGCSCFVLRGGLKASVDRLLCRLGSMYCIGTPYGRLWAMIRKAFHV